MLPVAERNQVSEDHQTGHVCLLIQRLHSNLRNKKRHRQYARRGIARETCNELRRADFPSWLGSQGGVEEAFGEEEQVCGWICFLSVSSMSEEDGVAADGLFEM